MSNTTRQLVAVCVAAITLSLLFCDSATAQLIAVALFGWSVALTYNLATQKNRLPLSWAFSSIILPFVAPLILCSLKPRPPQAMDVIDKCWYNMERDTNLMMVVGVLFLDDPISIPALKQTLRERLLVFDRFTFKTEINEGHLSWLPDPDFELDDHLEYHTLIDNEPHLALNQLANALAGTKLDPHKALWKLHLVEYGKPEETTKTAVIIRIHHCIGDGTALIRVLLSMTDETISNKDNTASQEQKAPAPASTKPLPTKPLPTRLAESAHFALQFVFALKNAFLLPDSTTSLKAPLSGNRRLAWSEPSSLIKIKELAHKHNAKVNDIVLAATAGAVRHYFESRNEPVNDLCVRVLVPINIRPLTERIELGNKVGFIYFPLPIDTESPIERLLEVKQRMDNVKGGQEALLSYGFLVLLGLLPRNTQHTLIEIFNNNASATMTNVPGPRTELSLASSPIDNLMFFGPQSGKMGVGISILSYNNQVTLGVSADANMIAEPELLVRLFTEQIQQWPE